MATGPRGSNVSVTSINCEMDLSISGAAQTVAEPTSGGSTVSMPTKNHFFNNSASGGSIRISVPKIEESDDEVDPELSNIETAVKVNMRPNKADNTDKNGPRPMSWEGELSEQDEGSLLERINPEDEEVDNEDSNMEVDCSNSKSSSKPDNFSEPPAIKKEKSETISIKPEFYEKNLLVKDMSSTSSSSSIPPPSASNPTKFEVVNLKYEQENGILPLNSPLLVRSKSNLLPANPSPDSAIHSVYTHSSPSQSPLTSRHAIYTPSLSRNNSDASHSSCYSYSSEFSPTHSPIQGRHHTSLIFTQGNHVPGQHHLLYRPLLDHSGNSNGETTLDQGLMESSDQLPTSAAGISRQQLINSPCPICGDKISGFHYGIFSCESCKGFFKRTVQNRKNYVCVRGAACPVTIATRKKCPACRFEKCLQRGMKLEAIREDRTRGGRSTYQCSFTLPGSMLSPESTSSTNSSYYQNYRLAQNGGQPPNAANATIKKEDSNGLSTPPCGGVTIPQLLQEIMDVEHLWQMNESELSRLNQPSSSSATTPSSLNPLLASAGLVENGTTSPDVIANLCNIADHRLYKIVKWCKSLPLFKHISIDDQICLLINSWCELLLFSCCYRSVTTPGEIRISLGKSITLSQAKSSGLQTCIERMLNLTDHLRRLRVDRYEYVAMKVIVLLQSDTSELKEPEKVRTSQEKALQALQSYTLSHYPESPAKFGELLLRIPELQRTCQVGKEMLTIRSKEGEEFNLLMELLRGEH